ncbi:CZB domain-containing protein [Achromobacter xylosoxidans]
MNLDESIQKHAEWKLKFRSAINRKEQLDADTIEKDNCCQLGHWLHGEGKLKYGANPEFGVIVQKHKAFHTEAGKIARLINRNQYESAEKELGAGTAYSQASNAVGAAIIAFKRRL